MPTYPVIHKETGEKKELSMTMKEYCEWKKPTPSGIKIGKQVSLVSVSWSLEK